MQVVDINFLQSQTDNIV